MKASIKILVWLLPIAFVTALSTCSKEKEHQISPLMETKWKVWSITAPDRRYILISPTPYQITFNEDNVYNMKLDVNSCGSTYKIENGNKITIDPIYCTEICCDKAFADTLLNILKKVDTFKMSGDTLELLSSNRIINISKANK